MIPDFYHESVGTNNNILTLSIIGTLKLPKRFTIRSAYAQDSSSYFKSIEKKEGRIVTLFFMPTLLTKQHYIILIHMELIYLRVFSVVFNI